MHYAGVDPEREPSADWGWHDTFPRAGPIAGWCTAFALFAMLIGNHRGRIEDIYLIGLGTVLVVMLIFSHLKAYKARRLGRSLRLPISTSSPSRKMPDRKPSHCGS